jgi:hypothetical protein
MRYQFLLSLLPASLLSLMVAGNLDNKESEYGRGHKYPLVSHSDVPSVSPHKVPGITVPATAEQTGKEACLVAVKDSIGSPVPFSLSGPINSGISVNDAGQEQGKHEGLYSSLLP